MSPRSVPPTLPVIWKAHAVPEAKAVAHSAPGAKAGRGAGCGNAAWRAWLLAALLLALSLGVMLRAQPSISGVVKGGFTFPELDRQNPARLRSLLTGVGARPYGDGQVWLESLRYLKFDDAGHTNLVLEGTNCVFDPKTRVATSPGRLRVESGDGLFVIEGVGFHWRQTNLTLTVSNAVHTRLRGTQIAATKAEK